MIAKYISLICVFLIANSIYSQEEKFYNSSTISPQLLNNSNAVVRYEKIHINIESYNRVNVTNKRIVTVFNENGEGSIGAILGYSNNRVIKKLEALIYDKEGEEIKKIKKNDFEDVSAVDGGTLYSDSRVKYLSYTPISYPYTVEFNVEIDYKSTAFLPRWTPIEGYYAATEFSEYLITNESDVSLKLKESNFDGHTIKKVSEYHYKAMDIKALKYEVYSPPFIDFTPNVKVAMTSFDMEGVKGINNDWKDFGKWMHDNLLVGTETLPQGVIKEVKDLTAGVESPREKAKIVYNYMQAKTRYISVQVGIGGWKPMLATDVDRLGYADCKGLSNYTKALLNEVGVPANYAVVYGNRNIQSIDKDFSATEGNHVILNVPTENENIWLECTSQTVPFGFIAGFTDDRDVLLITPEGGKIAHTTIYPAEDNLQHTLAETIIDKDGNLQAEVSVTTHGYQYSLHRNVQFLPIKDQEISLKQYWDNINNLKLNSYKFIDDKDKIEFSEKVSLTANGYATKTGSLLLMRPNAFNKVENIPTRYTPRTHDFEIDRGFVDTDEFTIILAEGLSVEALPKDIQIDSKFGKYNFSITQLEDNKLLYKRTYALNKGFYPKEEYEDFRSFMSSVVKNDNSKLALKTN